MTTPRGLPHHMTPAECERLKLLRQVHTIETCAELLGRSTEAVRRCIARGFQPYSSNKLRSRPPDFALLADTMTMSQLAHHYRTSLEAVRRWSAEIGRKHKWRGRPRALPRPADLAERIAELGVHGAIAHYGVSEGVMQRWREEAGLPVRYKRREMAARNHQVAGQVGWVDRYAASRRLTPSQKENARA